MSEKEIYFDLAVRYLKASKEEFLKEDTKIEVSAFCVYHAYENIACATISHFNRVVPTRTHAKKLRTFYAVIKNDKNFKTLRTTINALNYQFLNMRNQALYPQTTDEQNFDHPKVFFAKDKIKELQKRVEGIINKVEKII